MSVEELDAHNRRVARSRGSPARRPTLVRLGKKGVDLDATTVNLESMPRGGSSSDDISDVESDPGVAQLTPTQEKMLQLYTGQIDQKAVH